jgi:K+:H+ antiporter
MPLDPGIFVHHPIQILAIAAIVNVGKSVVAILQVRVLPRPASVRRVVGASQAQIGEFSFIVAEAGRTSGLFTDEAYQVVVAVSLVFITLNPALFASLQRSRTLPDGLGRRRTARVIRSRLACRRGTGA